MLSPLDMRVQAVDATTLTPLVHQALGRKTGRLTHWTAELLQLKTVGGGMGPSAIYRSSGSLQDQDMVVDWSLTLKVISSALRTDEVGSQQSIDIRREVEFYQSDLVHQFPAGFRAARCHTVSEQVNEAGQTEYWLWLETVPAKQDGQWTLDDHYHVARGLGLLNGAFLVDRPLPALSWLNTGGIRSYLALAAPMVKRLFEYRELPLVQRAFSPALVDSFSTLWQSREQHLQTLDKLPQTLCHGDAQVSNLFLQVSTAGQPEIVAIDWSQVGPGPIGLDLSQLLAFSLGTRVVEMAEAKALDQAIFDGYLAGLQAIGWQGDPKLVRLGYTAAMLKARTTSIIRAIPFLTDDTIRRQAEPKLQAQGLSLDDLIDSAHQGALFYDELFRESLELRRQLLQ